MASVESASTFEDTAYARSIRFSETSHGKSEDFPCFSFTICAMRPHRSAKTRCRLQREQRRHYCSICMRTSLVVVSCWGERTRMDREKRRIEPCRPDRLFLPSWFAFLVRQLPAGEHACGTKTAVHLDSCLVGGLL